MQTSGNAWCLNWVKHATRGKERHALRDGKKNKKKRNESNPTVWVGKSRIKLVSVGSGREQQSPERRRCSVVIFHVLPGKELSACGSLLVHELHIFLGIRWGRSLGLLHALGCFVVVVELPTRGRRRGPPGRVVPGCRAPLPPKKNKKKSSSVQERAGGDRMTIMQRGPSRSDTGARWWIPHDGHAAEPQQERTALQPVLLARSSP